MFLSLMECDSKSIAFRGLASAFERVGAWDGRDTVVCVLGGA